MPAHKFLKAARHYLQKSFGSIRVFLETPPPSAKLLP